MIAVPSEMCVLFLMKKLLIFRCTEGVGQTRLTVDNSNGKTQAVCLSLLSALKKHTSCRVFLLSTVCVLCKHPSDRWAPTSSTSPCPRNARSYSGSWAGRWHLCGRTTSLTSLLWSWVTLLWKINTIVRIWEQFEANLWLIFAFAAFIRFFQKAFLIITFRKNIIRAYSTRSSFDE